MIKIGDNKGISKVIIVLIVVAIIVAISIAVGVLIINNNENEKETMAQIQKTDEVENYKRELENVNEKIKKTEKKITLDNYLLELNKKGALTFSVKTYKVDDKTAYIIVEGKYGYFIEYMNDGNIKITYKGTKSELKSIIDKLEKEEKNSNTNKTEEKTQTGKQNEEKKNKDNGENSNESLTINDNNSTTIEEENEEEGIPAITGDITATLSTTGWTNKPIQVTLPTIDGYEIRYEINRNATNESIEYLKPFEVSKNCTIRYVYSIGSEIGEEGVIVISNFDELPPNEFEPTITCTSSCIKIKAKTEDQESETSGKSNGIQYRFSKDGGETYTGWQESGDYTFEGLVNNQKYKVVVQAKDAVGNTTTTTTKVIQELKQVPSMKEEGTEVIATVSTTEWTNGPITVTLPTIDGFETRYEIDGTATKESAKYTEPFEVSKNCTIRYVYSDGTNIGEEGVIVISNFDEQAPKTFTPTVTTTTNSIAITSETEDQESTIGGKSDGIKYRFSIDNGTTYTEWQESGNYTFEKVSNSEEHKVIVQAKDAAGNITTTTAIPGELEEIPTLSGEGGVVPQATVSTTEWTNGPITVTLPTIDGFETRYEINGTPSANSTKYTEPFEVSKNCTIKYVYSDGTNVGGAGTLVIANYDELAPNAFTPTATTTTNSITVVASTTDQESETSGKSGGITYRFSKDNGTTYTEWQTSGEYTFSGLSNNEEYTILVQAKDLVGNTKTSSSITKQPDVVTSLTSDIIATISPIGWTNQAITVTLPTMSGFETRYEINGIPTTSSMQYTTTFTVEENCVIKYVYSDGINIGGAGTLNISNYDNLAPNAFTPTATSTTNSITVIATTTDQNATETSGKSNGVQYKFSKDNGTTYTEWQTSDEYTFTGLVNSEEYTIKVQARDEAGNTTTGTSITKQPDAVTSLASDTIATISPTEWTNQAITVTLPTISGFETRYEINGTPTTSSTQYTAPFTLEENCVIKYVYSDGINIGEAGTINVENYDITKPQITGITAGTLTPKITITGTDEQSKITGYFYNTTGTAPTKDTSGWNNVTATNSLNIDVTGLAYSTKYYFWLKDAVGNISDRASATTIVSVSSIELSTSEMFLRGGNCPETTTISANVLPLNADNKSLTWTSSDEDIATIDDDGVVTAGNKKGIATITATSTDGSNISDTISIYVTALREYFIKDGDFKTSNEFGDLEPIFEGMSSETANNSGKNWPKFYETFIDGSYTLNGLLFSKASFEEMHQQRKWYIEKTGNNIRIYSELYGANNVIGLATERASTKNLKGNLVIEYAMDSSSYLGTYAFTCGTLGGLSSADVVRNLTKTGSCQGNEDRVWFIRNIISTKLGNSTYFQEYANILPGKALFIGSSYSMLGQRQQPYAAVNIRNYYYEIDAIKRNNTEWTNQPITITIPTVSGLDVLYTTDGTNPTASSSKYTGPFTVSKNCTIKYAYTDGTNIGGVEMLKETKYDNLPPNNFVPTVASFGYDAIKITGTTTDQEANSTSGKSDELLYRSSSDNGVTYTEWGTSIPLLINLESNKTYKVVVQIKDAAGNITTTSPINHLLQ